MANRKRVVIHCGFRKAGSTSIQRLLRKNRRELNKNMLLSVRESHTEPFRKLAIRYVRARDISILHKLKEEAKNISEIVSSTDKDTVLISDENLFGSAVYNEDGTNIFDWACEILPILNESLSGHDLTYYFVTRNIRSWVKSTYKQEVYNAFATKRYEDWIVPIEDQLSWEDFEKRINKTLSGSKVVVKALEDISLEHDTPGKDLLFYVLKDKEFINSLPDPGRANVRVGEKSIEFMRRVNESGLDKDNILKVRAVVEASGDIFDS